MFCSIIVTYNPDNKNLFGLVDNLLIQKSKVIIVDNNSIKKPTLENENVLFIYLEKNEGIAYAQNLGIDIAMKKGGGYIFFFDQDSQIDCNFIEGMTQQYKTLEHENIFALGPVFMDAEKEFYYPSFKLNRLGWMNRNNILDNPKKYEEVSVLISSGMMVSTENIKKVGKLRDIFFIDYVDTDWCLRALSLGYKNFMSYNNPMIHKIGDDSIKILNFNLPKHSPERRYYRIRNLFYMSKIKYIPKFLLVQLFINNLILQLLLIFFDKRKKDYIVFFFKSIKDGIIESRDYHE